MKKRLYLITTILLSAAALSLSSCLKDNRYVDFSKAGNIVDFPLGGKAFFGADAITETPDTDANGTIVRQFAVNIASANVPTTATTVTMAVDNSIIDGYNTANPAVTYLPMPSDAFVFTTTTATIPAGKQYANVSVTFFKNKLDPSKSYMLPIKIVSATGGHIISGSQYIHYYHFIGNDFAGGYEHFYTRWSNGDSTTTPSTDHADLGPTAFNPVSPTEFTVQTGYFTAPNYDVTFVKTGTGAAATYSHWTIRFLPADVAPGSTWDLNITVTDPPQFRSPTILFDPNTEYTYAQSLQLFRFYFHTATRAIADNYVHL